MVDGLLLRVAKVGFDVQVIAGELGLYGLERIEAGVVVLAVGEGDGVERGKIVVMRARLIVVDALHALDRFDLRRERGGLLGRDVRDHHLGCAEGGELLVHDVESLLCFGIVRQVGRQVVFDLDPAAGENGEDQQDDRQQKDEVPLVDNECGDLFHKGGAGLGRVVTHGGPRCLPPSCGKRAASRAPVRL